MKKDEIVPFVMTWDEPWRYYAEERSQMEKHKYHIISLVCEFEKTNFQTK